MASSRGQLSLGAFLHPSGHHVAAWRHPDANPDAGGNLQNYIRLARLAEAEKFDLVFLADTVGFPSRNLDYVSHTTRGSQFEPLTLLSALAAATDKIGLVATVSTSFNEPFNLARYFASLDGISGGRSGWNVVTSGLELEGLNFNLPRQYSHSERYSRAAEFTDVVKGLWDSWDDDAFVFDKASSQFSRADGLHTLNHRGTHFSVRGPLGIPRSPQGQPVIVQAGASNEGRELAARTAEVIFVAHQTLAEAQEFYGDVKERLGAYDRSPDDLKVLPGVFPVVGRTESEAREKFELLQSLVHPVVGITYLSQILGGIDLSGYSIDDVLPDTLPITNASQSRQHLLLDLARREKLTIRQLYLRIAGARGHWQLVGTPKQIADELEEYFVNFGADGFNIMPPSPTGLDDFVELVLPELRRRGLFREDYTGSTLRSHLGLSIPESRYAASGSSRAAE